MIYRCSNSGYQSAKYQALRYIRYLLVMSICVLLFAFGIKAETEPTKYRAEAYRTVMKIKIDGVLDEVDWQKANPITDFVQVEPNEGEPITQPTEIRILYDDRNIYFGYTCYDSDISKAIINEMRRDASGLYNNDYAFLILDPYNDRRSAVFFRFNAIGGVEDTAISNSGDTRNDSWDAVWESKGKINQDNWVVEIAIPFSQLRFRKSDVMTWGINLGRNIARNREAAVWSPVPKSYGGMAKYRTAYFGDLVGLNGISPSRNLELLPYVSGGVSRVDRDNDEVHDAGLDIKYGITTNLTADATFNTDFAQVEADQEQVNLTRFSLFFPEKRPFFMEGAALFDFGIPRSSFRRPPPLLLFYSRRIGLAEDRVIPIIAGTKITGKVTNRTGTYGVGLLNVFTDDFQDHDVEEDEEPVDEPHTNYTVLRLTRDMFSGSSIGLMAVNKQDSDTHNRATGLDFALRPGKNLNISGLWARTFEDDVSDEEDASGNSNAFYFGGDWRNDYLQVTSSYTDIGEGFKPEAGFVLREGIRHFRAEIEYSSWPRKWEIRRFEFGPEFEVFLNRDNDLETREVSFGGYIEPEIGGFIGLNVQHIKDTLEEAFEIREGVFIPVGEYNFAVLRTFVGTNGNRKVSCRIFGGFGEFFNGKRRGFNMAVRIKPNARLNVETMFDFNRIILPQDSFNASIFGSRVSYSFSTKLFAKLFAQWNGEADLFSTNLLINYIYRPGSDFYLVVNQNYNADDGEFRHEETTVIAKVTYWWNP